jgi:hypothetical protein
MAAYQLWNLFSAHFGMCDMNDVSVRLGQGTAEENRVLVSVRPHISFRFTPGFRWMFEIMDCEGNDIGVQGCL